MSNAPSHSSLNTLQVSDKLILWTILISFCIHAAAAWLIPNLSLEKEAKKEPLKVQIIQKPAPVAKPEPIKPPPKPKPKKKIKKKVKPKKVVKPKPLPKVAPTPLPVIEPEVIPEPEPLPEYVPPPVIAVEPPPEPTPDPTPPVPVAPPPPPPGPTQSEVDSARTAYIGTLQAEMRKHKKYPRIAKTRGWQGRVVIEFSLDSQGRITNTQVIESSGHKALDNQAIKMAEKAAPFPLPPPLLRGKSFSVRVPVPFKLRQE